MYNNVLMFVVDGCLFGILETLRGFEINIKYLYTIFIVI